MSEPSLTPIRYKIEQDRNEFVYFIERVKFLDEYKWAVMFSNQYLVGKSQFMDGWMFQQNPVVFDSPEKALAAWNRWYAVDQSKNIIDNFIKSYNLEPWLEKSLLEILKKG